MNFQNSWWPKFRSNERITSWANFLIQNDKKIRICAYDRKSWIWITVEILRVLAWGLQLWTGENQNYEIMKKIRTYYPGYYDK